MKYTICLLGVLVLCVAFVQGQAVSINPTGANPDPSAALDVQSTTRGMLIPRMDSNQRNLIASPATGLLVYDTDTDTFWFFDGNAWIELVSQASDEIRDADQDTRVQVEESDDEDIIRMDIAGTERAYWDTLALRTDHLALSLRGPNTPDPSEVLPDSGAGVRLMWLPARAAFRSGVVLGTEWNRDSIGLYSFVGGGGSNIASGDASAIVGGGSNQLAGSSSAIAGGESHVISQAGNLSGILGGQNHTLRAGNSGIVGGSSNQISDGGLIATNSVIAGGAFNLSNSVSGFIGGGAGNTTSGLQTFVGGGQSNEAALENSFVGGGMNNGALGAESFVGGGDQDSALSNRGAVVGGQQNRIVAFADDAFIGGGTQNEIIEWASFIGAGTGNVVSGRYAFASGIGHQTVTYGETNLGSYSRPFFFPPSASGNSFQGTDPLFLIGNGSSNTDRSNALAVLKDGKVAIGDIYPETILHVDSGRVLLQGNYLATPATLLPGPTGNTTFYWIPERGAVYTGQVGLGISLNLDSLGDYSFRTGGTDNRASGDNSFVGGGYNNVASGLAAAALGGNGNTASADFATVIGGNSNTANAPNGHLAGGVSNTLTGSRSGIVAGSGNSLSGNEAAIAGGQTHVVQGSNSFVGGGSSHQLSALGTGAAAVGGISHFVNAGSAFIGGGSTDTVSATNGFVAGGFQNHAAGFSALVGGVGNRAPSYAETVIGHYAIPYGSAGQNTIDPDDRLFVIGNGTGFSTPANALTVFKNGNTSLGDAAPGDFRFKIKQTGDRGLALEDPAGEQWEITINPGDTDLDLNYNGAISGSFDGPSGDYFALSDVRAKTDIQDLPAVLPSVMGLSAKTYVYRHDAEATAHLGFLAQEVQAYFPELVHQPSPQRSLYALNYGGMSVVAIQAIQEQQHLIEQQQVLIEALMERVEALEQE